MIKAKLKMFEQQSSECSDFFKNALIKNAT